jgi:hypothetical protein
VAIESAAAAEYRRNLVLAAVPTLAVPVAIGAVCVAAGVRLDPIAVGAGAIGWLVALALRAPVALVASRRLGSVERAQPWITGASGPLEEIVRLVILFLVGRDLDAALSVGLGWAGIEVVYSLVNGIALMSLAGRSDPEAEQARAMLPFRQALEPAAPWWGVIERVWASGLHIGFTLLVAAQPALVVATIVVHSAVNLSLLRFGPRLGLARFQLLGLSVAAAVLLAAALIWR